MFNIAVFQAAAWCTIHGMKKSYFSGVTKSTILLACASFFSDISTEMLYPVMPIFITDVLKSSPAIVGVIEGIATAVQFSIQGFSGWFADHFQRKKPVAITGYILAAVAKPLIGLSTIWPEVLAGRFLDRLGAGTRSAPRDALIAESTSPENRGKAFGLEGFGDNLGAFVGPFIAIALLYVFHIQLRFIFYFAFIPGILAVAMIVLVQEKKIAAIKSQKLHFSFSAFPKTYWNYMLITALFGVGNSSNAFLILYANSIGIPLFVTILIYAGFNLIAALSSFPAGSLSDTLGRKTIFLGSLAIFLITYVGFASSHNAIVIGILFLFYGIFSGIYRAIGKIIAVDFTPNNLRATGVGIYSTVIGMTGFVASLVGGQLWISLRPSATFYYSVVFSCIALVIAFIILPETIRKTAK